jgi:ABC-type cobalamin/Fe3+-siderophores transport system ATPase subunit
MALLLNCDHLSKAFGLHSLFQGVSFGVEEGMRLGVIGPNGAGKSTLLRVLAGEETADDGTVVVVGGAQPRAGDWVATSPWLLSTMGTTERIQGVGRRVAQAIESELGYYALFVPPGTASGDTPFLSLMLGLGKRRHEIGLLNQDAVNHRPVLSQYSRSYIDQMLMMMAASSIITYAIYTINSQTAQRHPALVYTVPFVLYAIMRYVYLVQHFERGGQPEEIFLTDRPMSLTITLWGLAVMAIFLWPNIAACFAGWLR